VVEQNNVTGTTPGPIVYSTIGGPNSSVTIGGWSATGDVTITTPQLIQNVVGQTIVGGIGIMPGDVTITNADGTPATNLLGPSVIGPPDYSQGPASGYMALADALDRRVHRHASMRSSTTQRRAPTSPRRYADRIGNIASRSRMSASKSRPATTSTGCPTTSSIRSALTLRCRRTR
jgi:hypothetical protein